MKETSKITTKELSVSLKKMKQVKLLLKSDLQGEALTTELNKLGVSLYAPALPGIIRK
jgi:hypothetical protein